MNLSNLSFKEKNEIFRKVQENINLHTKSIEKDWWVTAVIRALFSLPYAEDLLFKGGTSLSKCRKQ
jgi:predicted nucleotidyltransferase component of viral defense system